MSTTWVFLGLLAGRQLAISWQLDTPKMKSSVQIVLSDIAKAGLGLIISIGLAYGMGLFV